MKKNILLYILLGFLIAMNGFFLYKHFAMVDETHPQRHGQVNFIAEQLRFDATQLQKFQELDKKHRDKINFLLRDIKGAKDALFDKAMDTSFNDTEIQAITEKIANLEKVKALETFRFFNSISQLCNEDQRERFKKIISDGLQRQGPPPGNRPVDGPGGERRPPPPPRN